MCVFGLANLQINLWHLCIRTELWMSKLFNISLIIKLRPLSFRNYYKNMACTHLKSLKITFINLKIPGILGMYY